MTGCWRQTGIFGDSTCEALPRVIHCRNCVEYSRGGRSLFNRPASPELLREWTAALASPKDEVRRDTLSVVVFRLEEEWLALRTDTFAEVSEYHAPHIVPFRTGGAFLGLVNVNGELLMCVSLKRLLALPDAAAAAPQRARTCVISRERERFAFPVDEVMGVVRMDETAFEATPATVAKAQASLTNSLFPFRDRSVGLLDPDKLFAALGRSVAR